VVRILEGDLFQSDAQTLVNTVNCVGVMGKGIALEFRKRFPEMYADYLRRCRAGQVRLGEPYVVRRLLPPWIINFPTKQHWRAVSHLSDIVRGLDYLERHYREWGITSLAVPPLGCGQGQLEWRVVGPTLYRHLRRLDIPVTLYAPYGTPQDELDVAFLAGQADPVVAAGEPPRIDPAWVALVAIVARILNEPFHWPVGRTTFQKIAYFATEQGLPTGLQHEKSYYGPFAPGLKAVISKLVNNGLLQERPQGRMIAIGPGPTFADALEAYQDELARWEPIIDRVADLFLRMRTEQAEVAATVHYAARALAQRAPDQPSERDVLAEVMDWKQRRRPPLSDAEVARAIRNLNLLGWVEVQPSTDLPVPEDDLTLV
jgi:O-acetyl-ADP-ribose deacetylase (regulator of RNase III)/uncharacterized protein YwgA